MPLPLIMAFEIPGLSHSAPPQSLTASYAYDMTAHGIIQEHEIAHVRQYSNRFFCMLAARLLICFESLA